MTAWLHIVGIGEDGWDGLETAARAAIAEADILVGGARHLALLPPGIGPAARHPWPVPLAPMLDRIAARQDDWAGRRIAVLASGDPMLHGVGASLARRLPEGGWRVLPRPSAFALACARLGWPQAETSLLALHAQPLEQVIPTLWPGHRLVVYCADAAGPAALAALLVAQGYGPSQVTLFGHLGGPRETRRDGSAASWDPAPAPALNLVAIDCRLAPDRRPVPPGPGLADALFAHDGQLTKQAVRAVTLARLAPLPGQLLWDIGTGSGAIAIEWLRCHPANRAIGLERRADRGARARANALALGVPGLQVLEGDAGGLLAGLPVPDAIFIGGGIGDGALLEACWAALPAGGRLVANVVTVEGEAVLAAAHARRGGDLTRIAISHAEPVGRFHGWRPAMTVTQWSAVKTAIETGDGTGTS